MENNLTEYILNQEPDSVKQVHCNEDIDENLRKFLLENKI